MSKGVREYLPDCVKEAFDSIVEQRVLGASRHITMIGDMIEAIAVDGLKKQQDVTQIIDRIQAVAVFFIKTRGEASQAVSNAILLMIHNIDGLRDETDADTAVQRIIERKNDYEKYSIKAVDKTVDYAVKLAEPMENIFVYDYSSTIEKFLRRLPENGKKYTIYIAESRIIDGGLPFVKPCQEAGHKIHFIPDASMMYYLKKCDAAFMGAETFYPDGTGFNTTGSDITALICRYYRIPLYFLTPMIKLDIRPVFGSRKNLVYQDKKEKFQGLWETDIDCESIDFTTPELIGVPPEMITAFVTEQGVVPAGQMYTISMEYSKNLKGDT